MKKKLYDVDIDIQNEYDDITPETLANSRIQEQEVINTYKENDVPDGENKYIYLLRSLQPLLSSYDTPNNPENYLSNIDVQTSITAVIENLNILFIRIKNNDIKRKRFLIQEYSLGDNMLHSVKGKNGDIITSNRVITNNDNLTLKSFITT